MTKFLVTGASGLLGLNLALAIDGKEDQVVGIANTIPMRQVRFKSLQAELTEDGIIEHLLDEITPEVIVHCAALANVDDCEARPELAMVINACLSGRIATEAASRKIKMVHISTDAVFDGNKGNYKEIEEPHPLGVYARTKLEGERLVLAANSQALVVRVNFYGWSASGNRSLAEWFVNAFNAGHTVKGFTDVHFCPMMVLDLVDTLMEAITLDLSGVYHMVGGDGMTKFDFGRAIAVKFGFDQELIQPDSVENGGLKAARSPDLTLNTGKLVSALHHKLPSFNNGLQRFYEQYRNGFTEYIRSLT